GALERELLRLGFLFQTIEERSIVKEEVEAMHAHGQAIESALAGDRVEGGREEEIREAVALVELRERTYLRLLGGLGIHPLQHVGAAVHLESVGQRIAVLDQPILEAALLM